MPAEPPAEPSAEPASAEPAPALPPSRERAAQMFEVQARACDALGSGLYGVLLARAAEDIRAGGPCADAVVGYEDAPGPDAIALRLAGGVHALVLTGRAPALAGYYPSVGGSAPGPGEDEACWQAFRAAVAAELPRVREWMTRPPQTNEVGRANLLITGLLRASLNSPLPVRLFELGASSGLNLRPERFRYTVDADGYGWGPVDSPVLLGTAWKGAPPVWLTEAAAAHPELAVIEREGCDPSPIDPLSATGSLALRAYVWPDQAARHARLAGALRLAAELPSTVRPVGAAEFLAGIDTRPGTLTAVWHSVMRQYVPAEEWAQVERELARLAAAGTPEAPFVHIAFEPERDGERFPFRLTVRQGMGKREVLAEASPHGLPARAV
ncbi:DUF2332 domain-containing protein [Streptacidiphilus sp. N1-3]|uniref:DUF2332 domain-containing protein n=1 Tax=Streptacidiphilus alkalitolerans TaxID=3342712 RepID=A0ABV6X6Z9_9ACTN